MPFSWVRTVRLKPVCVCVAVTAQPGTAAPDASLTWPEISPTFDWLQASPATNVSPAQIRVIGAVKPEQRQVDIFPPPSIRRRFRCQAASPHSSCILSELVEDTRGWGEILNRDVEWRKRRDSSARDSCGVNDCVFVRSIRRVFAGADHRTE